MQTPPPDPSLSNYPRPDLDAAKLDLREIAISQRQIMLCILGQLGVGVLVGVGGAMKIPALALLGDLIAIGVLVFMIMAVTRLAKAMGLSAVLYAILMFIPCFSLLVLLSLSGKATKLLTQAGIKVGFLGADPTSI
jgi:hypothetical protein